MAKMGRKPLDIDPAQLEALMRMKPTQADTAAFFKCHVDTIAKYIREHYDLTFSEFREQNMVHTRFDLVRTAMEKARRGDNVMLIFCLKNLCGWRDKFDGKPEEDEETIKYKSMTTQELMRLVKEKTA